MTAERADLLARLAGGRLDRARALDGRIGPVREAFVGLTAALDGTGGAVAAQAELAQAALQGALTELEAAQATEVEELTAELEAAGYPERTQRAQLRRLEERHKRAHRRARTDALLEGITALETVYRDAMAGPGAEHLNVDREVLGSTRAPRAPRSTCAVPRGTPSPSTTPTRRSWSSASCCTCRPRATPRMPFGGADRQPIHSPPRRSSSDGRAAHS